MTTPTLNSAYPRPVEELLPPARDLADRLGSTPSRNQLMKELRIGRDKAKAVLAELTTPQTAPVVDPADLSGDPADPVNGSDPDPGTNQDPATPAVPAAPVPPEATVVAESLPVPPVAPGSNISSDPDPGDPAQLKQWKRIRWAVRAVLALGVAASIAGNVLHARDELISQVISAWSPLALLLTIELISRVPVHSRRLALARWAATALIAGIAAWVSYWHMAAVAARYGETNGAQYLLPLSVDGLVVVASICLVELGGRIASRRTIRT